MRYEFSLGRNGLVAVVAGLLAAGALLFVAGFLTGAVAAARDPEPPSLERASPRGEPGAGAV